MLSSFCAEVQAVGMQQFADGGAKRNLLFLILQKG